MQFGLSESQEFLKDSARKFFAGECPSAEMRRLMETDTAYDAALWSKLTDQGYTGIIFPEEYGGVGLGKVELMLLMEEAGRALLPGPFFSTVVWPAPCSTPSPPLRTNKNISRPSAEAKLAPPSPSSKPTPAGILATSNSAATNGKLTGEKYFVSDAAVADFILVVARNGVFVVERQSPRPENLSHDRHGPHSQTLRRRIQQHSQPKKSAPPPISNAPSTSPPPRSAAELVGGMQRTLDITVEYAKTRKQFGKPIGTFQAVQHQCADMYLETESSRSAVYYAGWALEENSPDACNRCLHRQNVRQ